MKNKVLQKLSNLISVLSTRQVGHTTLMKIGADSYDKPFGVIVHTTNYGLQITKENPNAKVVSISSLDSIKGMKLPVILDNHAIAMLLGDIHHEVDSLEKKAHVLEKNLNLVMEIFEKYQNLSHKAEEYLFEYMETPFWKIQKKKFLMDQYKTVGVELVAMLESMHIKYKKSNNEKVSNNERGSSKSN
jgi:hypothetical protein